MGVEIHVQISAIINAQAVPNSVVNLVKLTVEIVAEWDAVEHVWEQQPALSEVNDNGKYSMLTM